MRYKLYTQDGARTDIREFASNSDAQHYVQKHLASELYPNWIVERVTTNDNFIKGAWIFLIVIAVAAAVFIAILVYAFALIGGLLGQFV